MSTSSTDTMLGTQLPQPVWWIFFS